ERLVQVEARRRDLGEGEPERYAAAQRHEHAPPAEQANLAVLPIHRLEAQLGLQEIVRAQQQAALALDEVVLDRAQVAVVGVDDLEVRRRLAERAARRQRQVPVGAQL